MTKPFDHVTMSEKYSKRCDMCGLPAKKKLVVCPGCQSITKLRLTAMYRPEATDIRLAKQVLDTLEAGQESHDLAVKIFHYYLIKKKQQTPQETTELIDEILLQFETFFGKPRRKKKA